MARKSKEIKVEPSIFRAMIEEFPYKQITVDFTNKEDALNYVHSLTSDNTAWYGLYEINPKAEFLILVEHNRLRPHDNSIPKISKDNTKKEKRVKRKHNQSVLGEYNL